MAKRDAGIAQGLRRGVLPSTAASATASTGPCARCRNLEDILTRERQERAKIEKNAKLTQHRMKVLREELRELKAVVEYAHIQTPSLDIVIEQYIKECANTHIKKAIAKAGQKRADNQGG